MSKFSLEYPSFEKSSSNEDLDAAIKISNNNEIIVAVTGEVDYVTKGSKV